MLKNINFQALWEKDRPVIWKAVSKQLIISAKNLYLFRLHFLPEFLWTGDLLTSTWIRLLKTKGQSDTKQLLELDPGLFIAGGHTGCIQNIELDIVIIDRL